MPLPFRAYQFHLGLKLDRGQIEVLPQRLLGTKGDGEEPPIGDAPLGLEIVTLTQ